MKKTITALLLVCCILAAHGHDILRVRRDVSETVEKGNTLVSHLTEINSCFKVTQVTLIAGAVLRSAGFVGNLVGIVGILLPFGGEEEKNDERIDDILQKIDKLTDKIQQDFKDLQTGINQATIKLKAFIEKSHFLEFILLPVENLSAHLNTYLKNPAVSNKNNLEKLCAKNTPNSILNNMKTILFNGNVHEQLDAQDFTDSSFQYLQNLYRSTIMQILVLYPICEDMLNGNAANENELANRYAPIKKTVKEIEDKFVLEDDGRKQDFWSTDIMQRLMKKHLDSNPNKEAIQTALYDDVVKRYSQTGYKFAVAVYSGTSNAELRGNTIGVNHNGMNAFIMCTQSSPAYRECQAEHKTNYLPQLAEYILDEACPHVPALALLGPDTAAYGQWHESAFQVKRWGKNDVFLAKQTA